MAQQASKDSVIIVGAGPSGLVCALLLVRAGMTVTVLEQAQGLPEDMRASTLHPATLDLLEGTGVVRTLLGQGTRVPRFQHLRHGTDERIVFDLGLIADLTRHPFRLQVEQFRLTHAIVEQLRDDPRFHLQRGARVTRVAQDGVAVEVEFELHGEQRREQCGWLIGADGAHSAVRRFLGLPFEGGSLTRSATTVVLDDALQDEAGALLGVNYVWTETGVISLLRVRDLWRVGFSTEAEMDVSEGLGADAAQARLQDVLPRARPYRIQQINHYALQQRCLDGFRHGRILFCGDAAHVHSPAGGLGMNAGIQDAACLVEHLARVQEGEDAVLLDRYDRRRRTIAREDLQRLSGRDERLLLGTDVAERSALWSALEATARDLERQREYLAETSLLRVREREQKIE